MADGMDDAQREDHPSIRIGVALREPIAWHDFVQIVQTAEETGYEACFVPEIAGREAFSTLAALAPVTERVLLGTGIVPMHARRAMTAAMAAATVQELSGGRLILGLGTGPPGAGTLDRLRGYVEAVRAALAGRTFAPPDAPDQPTQLTLVPVAPPPIWISALGERGFALAGQIADGVLLNWCTPDRVARAREIVSETAARVGRDPTAITIALYVRANLVDEEPVAIDALRGATGQYASMPHYRRQMEAIGLGERAAEAARATAAGDLSGIPDDLVRTLCLVGDRSAALARLEAFREAGADLPIVYPVPGREPVSSIMGTILAAAPSTNLTA